MAVKLALVRQKYRPDGGAERFISRALSELQTHDLDLTIVARSWEPQAGIHFLPCNPAKWGRVSREQGFAKAVCKALSKENFDLVQSHERLSCCDIYRAGDGVHRIWLEQHARVMSPVAAWWMKQSRFHRYVMAAEKAMFTHPRLKKVICNSEMVKQEIMSCFNLPSDKLEVIYSYVDLEYFSPEFKNVQCAIQRKALGIPLDASVFIFVGSGFERKGLAAALAAMAKADNKSHLIVVGKDKRLSKYRSLANDFGIIDRVHFMGVQKDVRPFYAAADALILPTLYDPFPNVVLEAMASGLAVITSTKCGGAEFIESETHGYITDALDTWSMSHAIRSNSQSDWLRMGTACRQKIESLNLNQMGEKLTKLYDEVLTELASKPGILS
jgi:UDP-glucose:(heptosyl)LPS alpha-1,3-glucosyltransferase